MKKFMQKDLSKAPGFVNRAILRTARVLSQKLQKNSLLFPSSYRQRQVEGRGGFQNPPLQLNLAESSVALEQDHPML
jgi:hypothetical protein